MKNFNLKNENGRSMIEMLGVLAIIGVLSVGGIAGYSKAMQKYRINKTIEQITLIAGNIRAFFGPHKNYYEAMCTCGRGICSGFSSLNNGIPEPEDNGCPIIKKAKIFPDEMLTLDSDGNITSITNPFGHQADIQLLSSSGFTIVYYGISEEACIELITYDWTTAGVTVIDLFVNEAEEVAAKTPIDIDLGQKMCSKVATTPDYEFQLYFDTKDTFTIGLDEL